MLKQCKVSELIPGMMVSQVLEQNGPVKIRKVGIIRSTDMVKGLKEMGVVLVEIDESQSLHIEPDVATDDTEHQTTRTANKVSTRETKLPEPDKAAAPKAENSTATQRLVASDKQVADVDRQLSQQFHRSLFLPAVDQMPSKWSLYARPYAILLGIVCFGVMLGWFSTTLAFKFTQSENVATQLSEIGTTDNTQANANSDQALTAQSNNRDSGGSEPDAVKPTLDTQKQSLTQSSVQQIEQSTSQNASTNAVKNVSDGSGAAIEAQNSTTNQANQNLEQTAAQTKQEPVSYVARADGIVLEEGQLVLGYGADDEAEQVQQPAREINNNRANNDSDRQLNDDQAINPDDSNATAQNNLLNSELFRLVQQAADEVESLGTRPEPEVVNITDLNDVQRIDQLPPAVLTQMPSMSFSAHMYASNPQDRWVRVNSRRLGEGDYIADDLMILRIDAEKVLLRFRDNDFSMNALSDW